MKKMLIQNSPTAKLSSMSMNTYAEAIKPTLEEIELTIE
jgi:hypothetical protein